MHKFIDGQSFKFEPDVIVTLVAALEDAWASLQATGLPLYDHVADPKEFMALRIIEKARNGERNRSQLAGDAVGYLVNKILADRIN